MGMIFTPSGREYAICPPVIYKTAAKLMIYLELTKRFPVFVVFHFRFLWHFISDFCAKIEGKYVDFALFAFILSSFHYLCNLLKYRG